ncbi:amidohydrolase family protein [Roseomonas sp. OT10]|uniref:metal-dependent hydrolase family protein n=1 Tax=Roseomonas cutis TaxID=2897332 RepID=UPI001E43ECD2|nr:amidohydrolase family protein [Roseomonas sp. OT10]UFN49274.1 amidohydrolase family protein [Roseomonas sp. OT10]
MPDLLLTNFALLDVAAGELRSGHQVLVRGNRIAAVERGAIDAPGAQVLDLGGRTLMPGLIDCHVHMAPGAVLNQPKLPLSFVAARGVMWMREMVSRGFTTARDAGGADVGYRKAVEARISVGPRLFVAGRAISQTGGHGDKRWPSEPGCNCFCGESMASMSRIADGVPECRKAVRDELRMGANHIKVMAGGGVSSPSDSLSHLQYSDEELLAIVDEAARQNTYCMAHVYTAPGIRRAVELGIRTIEHGNFLDDETAGVMAARGAFLVPTLVTYRVDGANGAKIGFTEEVIRKNDEVLEAGTRSLAIAARAGVKIAYGTDLAYSSKVHQPEEFLVRAEVQKPADILRSATLVGAEVLNMAGKLGVVAPGAFADLLAVDGNPLEDLGVLQQEGAAMAVILKDGAFIKNTLAA